MDLSPSPPAVATTIGSAARSLFSVRSPVVLLIAGVATIALRAPWLLARPRFWAEEATVYFRQAFELPWLEALVRPHLGYFSLFNNLTAVAAAHCVPLAHAPLVTTLSALVVQAVPVVLIAWGRGPLLTTPLRRALCLAIVLLSPPSEEVWLNTINSQFHFGVAAALIVFDERNGSRAWVAFKFVVLALGGLTGPVAVMVAPMAALWALRTRSRVAFVAAAVLAATAIFQAVVMKWGPTYEAMPPRTPSSLTLMPVVFVARVWGESWLGESARPLLQLVRTAWSAGHTFPLALGSLAAVLTLSTWAALKSPGRTLTGLLLLTSAGMTVVAVWGAVGTDKSELLATFNGGRYFYLPGILWKLALLSAIALPFERTFRWAHALPVGVLGASLALNAFHYPGQMGRDGTWPNWRNEVTAWRENPARALYVWPPGWGVQLPAPGHGAPGGVP